MNNRQPMNVIDILRLLPLQDMKEDAQRLKVDFKAKKLDAISLLIIIMQGFLLTNRLSQRYIAQDAKLLSFRAVYNDIHIYTGPLAHSSISERLSKINPQFFEDTYYNLYDRCTSLFSPSELYAYNLNRVDSSLVAETANKLTDGGIATGVNDRFGGQREQVKYSMIYNGLGVRLAQIFSEQKYSADEIPLSSTVKEAIARYENILQVYLMDRGVSATDTFKDLKKETEDVESTFVGRLKKDRRINILKIRELDADKLSDDNIKVLADYTGNLRASNSDKWDDTEFRFIKVEFAKPRPKSPGPRSHSRRYDNYMLLITNDMKGDALTIAQTYLKR